MKNKWRPTNCSLLCTIASVLFGFAAVALPDPNRPKVMSALAVARQPASATPDDLIHDLSRAIGQQVLSRGEPVGTAGPTTVIQPGEALKKLESDGPVVAHFHPNGTLSHLQRSRLQPALIGPPRPGLEQDEETVRTFLNLHRELLQITEPDTELVLRKRDLDPEGRHHLRFRQEFQGLPVWPSDLMVHLDSQGNAELLDGAFVPTPKVETNALWTAAQAVLQARSRLADGASGTASEPQLIVYSPQDRPARLAWKFDLTITVARAWTCVVDARDGSVLDAFSLVTEGAVTGSGKDGLGITRPLHLWQSGSTYYLEDTSKPMYDPTSSPPNPNNVRGAIIIWDSHNTPATSDPTETDNFLGNPLVSTSVGTSTGWVPDAVGAMYGLGATYDYYLQRHHRNSLDDAGSSIRGVVRVGINWRNAFWTQSYKLMVFGDTLPDGLDVCAHELTHGVIFSTGDGGILNYHDQPGALNEALADIFGENVEAATRGSNDWLMGEDTVLGAIRNFVNPGSIRFGNNPYPSKMSEFYALGPDQDHGGVHINSSIINHAYYLLAAGLNGAIGIPDAERIVYRAMNLHLAKESQFTDFRHACIASAGELFGANSIQAAKVGEAFDAVELVDAPSTPPPSTVPVVNAADSGLFLRFDPFAGLTGQYELFRREAAQGDPEGGTFIDTVNYLAPERVSVAGNGKFVFYVTDDNDFGVVNTDGTGGNLGGFSGKIHSLGMTPDASKFAIVFLDSAGNPTNTLGLINLATSETKTFKLYGLDSEGKKLDIIKYADVLAFTADGKTLVYDAYSEFPTSTGTTFSGWTIYSLDLATTNITALVTLDGDYDFGNPSLGKKNNQLVTFEVIQRKTQISTLSTIDLFSGKGGSIGSLDTPNSFGKPCYFGDDSEVAFAFPDSSTDSGYSLVGQPMDATGLNPQGNPVLLVKNADFPAIYRRGKFNPSNALPTVHLIQPTANQAFPASTTIALRADAQDSDGTIDRVQFFANSTKLGESTRAPYSLTWSKVPAGRYNLIARAIDNLGGTTDTAPVTISVGASQTPPTLSVPGLAANHFQVRLDGEAGAIYQVQKSADLVHWTSGTLLTNLAGQVLYSDPSTVSASPQFYRAIPQ